jgi:predicted secreted protein
MTDPVLGTAIYIILWWLAFFCLLPVGAHSLEETRNPGGVGQERGAPVAPKLGQKALWAAGLAGVVWAIVQAMIAFDVFAIRG